MPGSSHCASTIALNCCSYRRRVLPLSLVIVSTYSYVDTILPGQAGQFKVSWPDAYQKLNRTYDVTITAEQSTAEKAAKTLLTPITATVDGLLVIGAIPLLLIASVGISGVIAAKCGGNRDCLK